MAALKPKYSQKEFARRGDAIFEKSVKPQIPDGHEDDFVLIDIESGAFEFDSDERAAADRLDARKPNAQIWMRKVNSRFSRRFGATRKAPKS